MHIQPARRGAGAALSVTTSQAPGFLAVAFLGVTAGVQMSDRGLQSILSPAIRATFGVGDAAMGLLFGVAGILVASALAVPLARLADRHSRKAILIGLILAWSGLTAVGALAKAFPLFFLGRAASGVTEFAMIPIVYSMIPDLVPERWRIAANLAFAALMAIGASAGFYLGGALLAFATQLDRSALPSLHDPWRLCMMMLGLAGLPLAAVGLLVRDPPRAAAAASADAPISLLAFFVERRRSILLFLGAAGGLAVAVQAVSPLAAMGVVRRFSADLQSVGHGLGVVTLITSLGCLPLAGLLDRWLAARIGARARPMIMMASSIVAVPCAVALAGVGSAAGAIGLLAGFLGATSLANALIPTMLQDLAPGALRARAFAAYSFLIAAFCAVGPVLAGEISDHVTSGDLMSAMSLASMPFLVLATASAALALKNR